MDNKFKYFVTSNFIYLIIILIMSFLIIFYGHYFIGGIALAVLLILFIYNIKNFQIKRHEWKRFIETFSTNLDKATRDTLVKLPLPLIIINKEGNVLWYNQNLSTIIESKDILGNSIKQLFSSVNVLDIVTEKKKNYRYLKLKDKFYDMHVSIIESSDSRNDIIILYLYDVTDRYELVRELENIKESVILIEVDNLDEVVKSTPEDKKPLLIAEVERNINSYAQSVNALFKKYATGKYVLVIQNKSLIKEMDKKFEILDIVREINVENKLAVTLSMGIGKGGLTPIENYNLAVSAKELALGRGGDQAVVKNGDKLSFYGGNTKEIEKRTKVRARMIAQSLVELIKESSNVIIMGHKNPDIDCFGGAIGIHSAAKQLDIESYIIIDGLNSGVKNVYPKFNLEKGYKDAFINSEDCHDLINENTLLIIVDVNSKSYVQNAEIIDEIKRVVVIDHHRKAANSIEDSIINYIEPYASSTSELVTEILQYMIKDYKMKPIEAETLLAGICVDTKNFYFKTGVRTFEAAAYLRKQGADTIDVKKLFSSDLESYIKKAEIIRSAEVVENIAIAVCPSEIDDNIIAAQAADELLNITGIMASFVLVKIENEVLISGRSFGDINVQLILEALGGGGHLTMAGAKVEITEDLIDNSNEEHAIEEVIKKLKKSIEKYLREGEK